mgnify:CR=1 FL=1
MKNKNKIKRKQRKYNKAQEGPELKRIGLDVKDEPRKGANILTLAIMGGAVFLGLRSCSDESPTPKITIFKGIVSLQVIPTLFVNKNKKKHNKN